MPTSNTAALKSLGALLQLCIEYANAAGPQTREAILENAQKHARVVSESIKDEPDASNHDQ